MQSRMDKYQTSDKKRYERTKKNTKLYEDVYDDIYRDTTYKNMQVLDSAREININKLKNMLENKYDTRQYRTLKSYSIDDIDDSVDAIITKTRHKSYDINEIILDAKSKRTFIEEAKEKQKYLDFKERQTSNYDEELEEYKKEEKELEELIHTMTMAKETLSDTDDALDMFSDLKGNDDTIVTTPIDSNLQNTNDIEEETTTQMNLQKTLAKQDKTFYTDSNMFTKNDFEDFTTFIKEESKSKSVLKIIVIILFLILLGITAYYLLTTYVLK